MRIHLKQNRGFDWFSSENSYFKGYFFYENTFYEKENAILKLLSFQSIPEFKNAARQFNGVFTIVITIDNSTLIVCDTTRSFPLFYGMENETLLITDTIEEFKSKTIRKESEIEILSSLHCYGNKTLFDEIFITQSSELLTLQNEKIISSEFLFSYVPVKYSKESYTELKEKTINVFNNVFHRLSKTIEGKRIALPLSAGYDSRLIACYLKKLGHKNVICYTYGRTSSFEIENSKKVAGELGFKWIFIPYSETLIEGFTKSNEFKKFVEFAGKYSSTPNFQEYFAVNYLKQQKLINENTVFISGYAGDLLGGSQFLKVIPKDFTSDNLVATIYKEKFNLRNHTTEQKEKLQNTITTTLCNFNTEYTKKSPHAVFEDFDIKEKITKYIFNSASFYTFFGCEVRFPFWDAELLEHFKKIPVQYKLEKRLFDDVFISNYFKPLNVYFSNDYKPDSKHLKENKLKSVVKNLIPKKVLTKQLEKSDWNNYLLITNELKEELLKKNLPFKNPTKAYNQIVVQWYLYFCKNKI
ncbi:asparagine synthase C-terminal domain-containing protein [uncultured Tenacibaculum sp.]|uniref:asparagine synthase C-terminal domain-containing protein n=1 Tax=uncultured Tenacibaculum sp. TaxID=174713 RepID=UPI00260DDBFC|nr:asparagine synthase C-terminal domain-containing protein [uncultured Tenacibaculum sp.]